VVAPGIYRGARPDAQGLRDLAALGVRTDLDLEKLKDVVATERQSAAAAGVTLVSEPMSYLFSPSDQLVDDILSVLDDPARQPVFVHCKLGNDRTGLVVAIHRVESQGWDPADAWDEALAMGFHRIWVGLSHYYEERTGYDD
jgi:tyrosine-protein phosphatase SIW14